MDGRTSPRLLAVAAALLAAPAAQAAVGFGAVVATYDLDATVTLDLGPLTVVSFADGDGDGALDADEPVYLGTGSATVQGNDVRLRPGTTGPHGSQVRASNTDFGDPVKPAPGAFRFLDRDGDGRFGWRDVLTWSKDGVLTPEDVLVGKMPTAEESGKALLPHPGVLQFIDMDADGRYDSGDVVVLDSDADGLATVSDVLLGGMTFGKVLSSTDSETTARLIPSQRSTFVFVDGDGDGRFTANDRAYLTEGVGMLKAGDWRLPSRSYVSPCSTDLDAPTLLLGTRLSFLDRDADGVFSAGDSVVVDTDASEDMGSVELRIPDGLAAGATDRGRPLLPLDYRVAAWDLDRDGRDSPGDLLYLDGPGAGSGFATVLDVRLYSGATQTPFPAKGIARLQTSLPGFALSSIGFVDGDGDGRLDPGEAAYLTAGSAVAAGDVRLGNGSTVAPGQPDVGVALQPLPLHLAFYDANDDAAFSPSETAYLDLDASATVTVGDLVLSGSQAGGMVNATSTRLNNPLDALPHGIAVFDDGDGRYDAGDAVLLDGPGSGHGLVSVQDVRLTSHAVKAYDPPGVVYSPGGSGCGSSSSSSSRSSTTGPPPMSPTGSASPSSSAASGSGSDGTQAESPSTSRTESTDSPGVGTPGLPSALLPLALACAALLRRRLG